MLNKQNIGLNFAQGLDTKTDPKQVGFGKFLSLENTIFEKGGLLQKRNGYAALAALSSNIATYLTTFNGNLTAVGTTINAYNASGSSWISKGNIQPLELSTLPLIRNSINQTQCDVSIASNGLVCTVYTETNASTTSYKYAIADSTTGQNVIQPSLIPVASGVVTGSPRVFNLGNYFIIVFTNFFSPTSHLQYVAISTSNPSKVTSNVDISASYAATTGLSWDAVVANNNLYVAYDTTAGGQAIKMAYLSSTLSLSAPVTFSGYKATLMSLCADLTVSSGPHIYINFYDSSSSTGFTISTDSFLNLIINGVKIISSGTILNIASVAQNGTTTVFYEVSNNYSYDSGIPSHYINSITVTPLGTTFKSIFSSGAGTITASSATGLVNGMYLVDNSTAANIAAGTTFTISGTTLTLSSNTAGNSASSPGDILTAATVSSVVNVIRSVGLASKAFLIGGTAYFLSAYSSSYQPTYFLINGSNSTAASPVISSKLAYSNGGGYLTTGLPNVVVNGNIAQVSYLNKDLISAVNKNTNVASGTQTAGIYSQTGIVLATFTIGTMGIDSAEIGNDLHLSGGFLWMYDGYLPVEHNFFLWPDNVEVAGSSTSGSMSAQQYFYQVTYEWGDNQGNIFRSAPSIPVSVTLTSNTSVTVNVPTLRLTYKTANPVKIVIYRWSVAQQVYYQVTSLTSAQLNSTTSDSITFTDSLSDATILGNNILYTTGGVIEDVNAPASNIMSLFDSRLWLVAAEDPNLLWYSKQVIESTPVEMSDLLTVYVAPSTGAEGSTGSITALAPMDDKLIIFKQNAIYYINGSGPDNTGNNNNYSQPIFITSTVGCSNQQSIVFMPQGLMFQSNKGIWLLGRDLSSSYIGAAVEEFNSSVVQSAINVPQTNQVRFTLDSGHTLMFDYYYSQWGTFTNVPAISSTIYQGLHTFLNSFGAVYQETPDLYVDGSKPVLMSFTTSWLNLSGLQGYQRAYSFYLLSQYYSPHKLNLQIAYDYNSAPTQVSLIQPDNFSGTYGSGNQNTPYGQGSPYGGPENIERWRVFLTQQRCSAFQITLNEIFDPSFGVAAGAGLTMSGINILYATKKGWRPISSSHSVGGGNG